MMFQSKLLKHGIQNVTTEKKKNIITELTI